jgi:lipopolysaccharide/colanic/teichoic acid biosynthesis glycosyltransferase
MTTFPIALSQAHPPRRYSRGWQSLLTVPAADAVRRALNIVLALAGLIVLAPLLVLVAIAVKLSSPGPVFYTQTRVGLNRRRRLPPGTPHREADCGGKPFKIYKFRTMRAAGETPTRETGTPEQVWATPDDPRITRIGRILRLYRLDEVPQLLNVLRGDMDIVGPRPEQPAIFARLREVIPGYADRQCVRPGITGWAQVNLHYDSSIEDVRRKLAFDLEYITRRSLTEDLRIMLRTFPVVANKFGGW